MKFSYYKIPVNNPATPKITSQLVPIIPIKIMYRNKVISYHALVDSGAEQCLMHADIGRHLGLTIEKGIRTKFRGIASKRDSVGYIHTINLLLAINQVQKTDIIFSDELGDVGFGILGQLGFFDKFKISFDYKKGSIKIK